MSKNTNKNITDLLNECTYSISFKDYIIKILIELSCQRGVIFFKTMLPGTSTKIVAIKYPMTIRLKGNPYEVKIIIYIVSDFPNKAPEIFIDNSGDALLAANPKNQNVNPENFRVITPKLFNWIRSTSIQEILTEIINSFEMNFPIYKKQNKPQSSAPLVHSGSIINANTNNNFNVIGNASSNSNFGIGNNNAANLSNFNSGPLGFNVPQQHQGSINNNNLGKISNNWNFPGAQGALNKNPAPVINGNGGNSSINNSMNNFNSGGGFNVIPPSGNIGMGMNMNNNTGVFGGFNNPNSISPMANQVAVPAGNVVNFLTDKKTCKRKQYLFIYLFIFV